MTGATIAISRGRGEVIDRLGEWLVRRRRIRRADLFLALTAAYRHNCRLGDAVVWLDLLDRATLELEAHHFHRQRAAVAGMISSDERLPAPWR